MSRGYWSDRENGFELAGVGRADMLTGYEGADYDTLMRELHRRIDTAAGDVRYFGGVRFVQDGSGSGASMARHYSIVMLASSISTG